MAEEYLGITGFDINEIYESRTSDKTKCFHDEADQIWLLEWNMGLSLF